MAPSQDAGGHRRGDERIDVAAGEIDARAGGGGDADHEVAGRGRDLDRQPHRQVHRRDLHALRADAQQPADHAGDVHQRQAERRVGDAVDDLRAVRLVEVGPVQPQPVGQSIRRHVEPRLSVALAEHGEGGIAQHRRRR